MMGFFPKLLNVITFGGYGRIQRADSDYIVIYNVYRQLYAVTMANKQKANEALVQLGQTTRNSLKTLGEAQALLSPSGYRRSINHSENTTSVEQGLFPGCQEAIIVLGEYHTISAAVGGVGVGGAAAIGSWSLVSLLGTASTGTAISGLAGAAATNATLAWFGGGAIAAGGAGMAGGTIALGGIVLIPMIAIATWSSHRKANKIRYGIERLKEEMGRLSKLADDFADLSRNALLQKERLLQAAEDLVNEIKRARSRLFPWGLLSKLRRRFRLWLNGEYYSDFDMLALSELDAAVSRFSALFDISNTK